MVLAVLALPWSAWLVGAVRPDREADATGRAIRQLLWAWLIAVTAFFSLPESKLVGYILPASWPVALLVAQRFGAGGWPRTARLARLCASAVLGAAACVGLISASTVLPRRSAREIGLALRGVVAEGDRVVLLHAYNFDLSFYARLREPVIVVEDWQGPEARRDNWRKELADAGRFDPVRSRALQLTPAQWPSAVCDGRTTWVIGAPERPRAIRDGQRPAGRQQRRADAVEAARRLARRAQGGGLRPNAQCELRRYVMTATATSTPASVTSYRSRPKCSSSATRPRWPGSRRTRSRGSGAPPARPARAARGR